MKAHINRNALALEERRREAIRLYKKKHSLSDIGRLLNVSRQAVHKWVGKYTRQGESGLSATKATGRPNKTTKETIARTLARLIEKGAQAFGYLSDAWTTASLRDVLYKTIRVDYHRDHIRKLLHQFGYSCQRPQKKARERDEEKIKHWVGSTWVQIKKKP
jgi:putative transposase